MLKSSGGVYPRLYRVPGNRHCFDSLALFRNSKVGKKEKQKTELSLK